jgi:tetratricopeptide (TPR) repeat protein
MELSLLERGIEKASQKDYQGAIAIFNEVIAINPYLAEAYYRRGLARAKLGNIQEAAFDYTEAIKRDCDRAEYYYARAFARLELKNFPGAFEDAEASIKLNDRYAPAYQLKGIVEQKLAQRQAAIASLKKAAELYLNQKDAESCRDCLQRIEELRSSAVILAEQSDRTLPSKFSQATIYSEILERAERGDCAGAIKELDWAIKLDDRDAMAYCCRGIVKSKKGDLKGAIADLNKAVELNPESFIACRHRGKLRQQLGDIIGALADFEKALQIDDRDDMSYIGRGNVRMAMGSYEEAIADFDKAIELNADNPKAYLSRAQAYAHQEELGKAISDWQTAASQFFAKNDWQNYRKALDSMQKFRGGNTQADLFTSSNFTFLENLAPQLYVLVTQAEQNYLTDPVTCLIKLKQFGEATAQAVMNYLGLYPIPGESQHELLNRLYFMGYLSDSIYQMFQQLRNIGDRAIQERVGDRITSLQSLQYARELSVWYYRNFCGDPNFVPDPFMPPDRQF